MAELLDRLGNPQAGLPIIHLAGTKGKGSTAAMLSNIACSSGYRVGLYTSPHLDRLEERFVINNEPCTRAELVEMVALLRPVVEAMDAEQAPRNLAGGLTYFEVTTALALLYFARRNLDLAILEVGMGGRLDSTNVCQPVVTAITSISLDHTQAGYPDCEWCCGGVRPQRDPATSPRAACAAGGTWAGFRFLLSAVGRCTG